MKAQKKDILIAVSFVLLLVVASIAYRALSARYEPESVPIVEAADSDERSVAASEPDELPFAADFTALDADGNKVRLSDCIGTPIIVNFWASWCPPCKAELPTFEDAYQTYGDTIRFLMVDLTDGMQETEAGAKAFIEENGYTFPVYFDTTGSAVNAYKLYSIPQTVAIDADGRVVRSQLGAMSEEALAAVIEALLQN